MWKLALPAVAIGAALAVYQYAAGRTSPAPTNPAIPVSMQAAKQQNLPIWLDAIGTVQPLHTVNVKVRVDGELQKVMFTEGQEVHAGDLLAQIDPRPFQTQLQQAQAGKAKDEAQLASTLVDLNRATKLAAAGAGPSQTVDTLTAQRASLKATVQADQAAIQNAQLQLDYTRIRAPFDGRTGQRLVDAGAIVHASDATGLVTITQIHPISILFTLPQDNLPEIIQESKQQSLKVEALTRDGARPIADGQLAFIDNQVASGTGKVQFKATFTNADGALWPGALVSVRVLLRTQTGATVVPATAVQQGAQGSFVYRVKHDHTVETRQVDAGPVVASQQWIRKGLQPGDIVVTQGQYRLAPGLKVAAIASGAQPTAAQNGVTQ